MLNKFSFAILPFLLASVPANAGIYTDDLSKCLVSKTNVDDQRVLTRWIFSAMSAADSVKEMSSTTVAQHDRLNKSAADLFSRLLLQDCRAATVAAMQYEGQGTVESSFQVLGQVAMRGLMMDPNVQHQLQSLGSKMDNEKLKALGKEAGVITDGTASPTK